MLSGALLARKGAASTDGFALADAGPLAARARSARRWRVAILSTTVAISLGAMGLVGAALMLTGLSAPTAAPERTTALPAAPSAAVTEPARAPPKPLAVAVATDVARRHGDTIAVAAPATREAAPRPPPVPAVRPPTPEPQPPPAVSPARTARQTEPSPPRARRRPADPSRAGYRVQLHALASDAAVRREWRRLRQRHGGLLAGLDLTVAPKRSDAAGRTVYRLQLGALSSRTEARALCRRLRRAKLNCIVVR